MKGIKLEGIEKYSNQWVALDETGTKIIVGGKSLKTVMDKAIKKVKKPIYMRVPPLEVNFAP